MAPILVRANPNEFVFAAGGTSLSVAPVVWYNAQGQIGAFGTGEEYPAYLRRLDLFPGRPYGFVEPLFQPLRHFLLYHFILVKYSNDPPWWLSFVGIRPHVRYESVLGFEDVIDGDVRALLERAARAAGARRVEISAPGAPAARPRPVL